MSTLWPFENMEAQTYSRRNVKYLCGATTYGIGRLYAKPSRDDLLGDLGTSVTGLQCRQPIFALAGILPPLYHVVL